MDEFLTRKNAIRFLLIAIFFVVMKIFWNVNSCISSGGSWDPQKEVCEQKIIPKPTQETLKKK